MQLQDAIDLIQNKTIQTHTHQQWADLGCGAGLFTHALANMLQAGSIIYAVDKNIAAFKKFSSQAVIKPIQLDFVAADINLHDLDGVLMANSLHYVKDKIAFIYKLSKITKAGAHLLFVEYDTDTANPWVPYPASFSVLQQLFIDTGYNAISKLHEHPSVYNRASIYSAIVSK
jgi:ubiquinone/menaquinone biosynthesis C-methylase UbiE